MATSPISVIGPAGKTLRATSCRLFQFAIGAWIADVVLDLDSIQDFPAGRCTAAVGGISLQGTTDPRNSGTFGPSARIRLVGGAGAWDQVTPSQDFANSGGLTSTQVYQQTAQSIGETLIDESPVANVGQHFVRSGGAASRVFRDNPWWVDTLGTTHVGPRPVSQPDSSLLVNDFDPIQGVVTFHCDTLLYPNTQIQDARFPSGSQIVYDIEQLFDKNGSRGWAWVTQSAINQLAQDLKSATLEWTRAQYLRATRYRLVQYQGNNLALQAVTPSAGLPNIVPLTPWSGLAGASTVLAPSSEVLVIFENADPTLPKVVGWSLATLPIQSTVDASGVVQIGPSAGLVVIAGGEAPLATGPWAVALVAALEAYTSAIALTPTLPGIIAASSALATALAALPLPETVKTTAT